MKKSLLILVCHFFLNCAYWPVYGQETPANAEQQLENLTDADQAETEDDSYLQQMQQFIKNPVDLNTAGAEELRELRILNDLQIQNLLSYRRLLGKFLNLYELQAVPGWDVQTIRRILPFVSVGNALTITEELGKRFTSGDHGLLIRFSQVMEKSKGYLNSSGSFYTGSPQRIFFRYRYSYKNLLQYGVVGDKDGGEQFFKGKQRYGFDFYSFHFFARKMGAVQALALGDFTVNMGQGLIQWQSLAFRKSVDVLNIKRQSAVLRPYNSAGEYNFHRGAGITVKKGMVEATAFASYRKIGANFTSDTINSEDFFSSFLTSGYHRTSSELADRNNLGQTVLGGNIAVRKGNWHVGVNGIHYRFSLPVQKRQEPYNFYAISGKSWTNFSADYSYTYRNLHFFGELASTSSLKLASVNGLLLSVDPRVDLSFLYRNIAPGYQSVNGNAFTESTYPSNEKGLFAGITVRPAAAWRFDAYADFYSFPWLKYLVDAPSRGRDFITQITYLPNRQVEFYTRYRYESKQGNAPDNSSPANFLVDLPRQNWRLQLTYKVHPAVTIRNRTELSWYDRKGPGKENGFLTYVDVLYKPMLKPFAGNIRLQWFETGGYNSRLYAYENDVLYFYSIPVFFDKGYRYYVNLNYDFSKRLSCWLKWSQFIYQNKTVIGSGLDEIAGNQKSELRFQLFFRL